VWSLLAAAALTVALVACPVRTTLIRAGILFAAGTGLVAARDLLPTKGRRTLETAAVAVLAWCFATSKPVPPSPERFVAALRGYEHTPYVWGGETGRGIGCSGLVRAALIDTQLRAGRPGAALRLWWRDVAARDLGTAYSSLFRGPERTPGVGSMRADVPAGAMGVTFNGLHVLAHLGGGRWIQASPEDHRVTIRDAGEPDPWFAVPADLWVLRAE
jgi:cell wall-associated NlpC family hydrolase